MNRSIGGLCALLILLATAFLLRLASFHEDSLVNIAPVAAMAVCFGLFASRNALGIALAFAVLVASDVMITVLSVQRDASLSFWGLLFSPTVLFRYATYGVILWLVLRLRNHRSSAMALGVTPCISLGFYVVMNTVAWALSTPPLAYAKTFAGWWQSQTIGLAIPGAPPSYVFLRNALIGDLFFTVLFIALMVWIPRRAAARSSLVTADSNPTLDPSKA